MIKELREVTEAGVLDCKKALEATDGDFDKAVEYLKEKGLDAAAKKVGTEGAKLYMEFYASKAMARVSKASRKYSKKGAALNAVKEGLDGPIKKFRDFQGKWMVSPFMKRAHRGKLIKQKKDAMRGIDQCFKKITSHRYRYYYHYQ